MTADVLVAGGGPCGLLIAGMLARQGLAVTVLEARTGPHAGIRASTLHARTMEVLDRHRVPGLVTLSRVDHGHYVGLPLDLSAAPSPWAGVWRCQQPDLVRRLTFWAQGRGVRIVRGERVTAVDQDLEQVEAWTSAGRTYAARVLVAADGADSDVRRSLGMPCLGPRPARSMVRADVRAAGLRPRRFERIGELTLTCAPLDRRTTRVMVHDPSWPVGDDVGADRLRAVWRDATGERLPAEPDWIDTFADTTTRAAAVTVGRTVLCGDAAHQFIPVGGTALNSALTGAGALADRIVAYLRDGDGDALEEHDRAASRRAEVQAGRLRHEARLLFGTAAADRAERAEVADRLARDRAFHDRIVAQVSGLDGAGAVPDGPAAVPGAVPGAVPDDAGGVPGAVPGAGPRPQPVGR